LRISSRDLTGGHQRSSEAVEDNRYRCISANGEAEEPSLGHRTFALEEEGYCIHLISFDSVKDTVVSNSYPEKQAKPKLADSGRVIA
jgi:hypothetical protein